ncbi:MAG: ribosome maturation factor RimM [Bacillota bacterium]|nr:ribosome maturation factor RimM [Bacillota bacterium]
MDELVAVGKITSTHGLRGYMKVLPLTDNLDRFNDLKEVFVVGNTFQQTMIIKDVQLNTHKNLVYILFEGITNVDQVTSLRNSLIKIPLKEVPILPADSYYHYQIVGLKVYDLEDIYLGKVEQIIATGANDVYLLGDTNTNKAILIPALKAVVKSIDIENQKMIVDPPSGLLDI